MERGWVKLWRKSKNSDVFAHNGIWKLWCLCLMKANHKDGKVSIPGVLKPIKLRPGQFITGRDSLHYDYHQGDIKKSRYSRKLKPVPKTLYRYIEFLAKNQNLSIKKYSKYSIITIINWPAYQENVQQPVQVGVHQMSTNKKSIYTCEFFSVSDKQHTACKEAYPTLDLKGEYKAMAAWLEANPQKRKTLRGYPRFVNNWLSKAYKDQQASPDWRDKLKPI